MLLYVSDPVLDVVEGLLVTATQKKYPDKKTYRYLGTIPTYQYQQLRRVRYRYLAVPETFYIFSSVKILYIQMAI